MNYPRWRHLGKHIPQHTEWLVVEIAYSDPSKPRYFASRKQYPEDRIGVFQPVKYMTYAKVVDWIKTQPLTNTFAYKTGDEAMDAWLNA